LTTSDIDCVRLRWRDRDRANRCGRLGIEDREPYSSPIDRLPDSAVHGAEVKLVGAAGNSGRGGNAATAERAEHSPAKSGKQIGRDRSGEDSAMQVALRAGSRKGAEEIAYAWRKKRQGDADLASARYK